MLRKGEISEDNRTYLRGWTRASNTGGTEYVLPKGHSQLTGFSFCLFAVAVFYLWDFGGFVELSKHWVVPGRHLTGLQLIK